MAVPEPQSTIDGTNSKNVPIKVSLPSLLPEHLRTHGSVYVAEKLVDSQVCTLMMTPMTKGQRNMMPECRPVPRPIDERIPRMSHQRDS
jgi:hypothetical protein